VPELFGYDGPVRPIENGHSGGAALSEGPAIVLGDIEDR